MVRLISGFLLGPLVLTLLVFCVSTFFFEWISVAKSVAIVSGLIAYAGVLLFGVPSYFYLKKINRLSLRDILLAALLAGAMMGVLFVAYLFFYGHLHESAGSIVAMILTSAAFFGICALPVAYTIWYIGIMPRHT